MHVYVECTLTLKDISAVVERQEVGWRVEWVGVLGLVGWLVGLGG